MPATRRRATSSENDSDTEPFGVAIVSVTDAPVLFTSTDAVPLRSKPVIPTSVTAPVAFTAKSTPLVSLYTATPSVPFDT